MKKISFLFLGLIFALQGFAQKDAAILQQMKVDVVYLASNYLEGREAGTHGEQLAAEYISDRFNRLGLKPAGTGGSWYQKFDFRYNPNPHGGGENQTRVGKNVVAFLDHGAKETIVVGAHYDHLGHGASGSLDPNSDDIHNGADDNASGVAALLYIADELKGDAYKSHNYLFIAFSAEELGLFGSKHYVKEPTVALDKITYMINMDMVGRLPEDKGMTITGTGTSPVWDKVIESLGNEKLVVTKSPGGIGPSDHTSFYLKSIPAIHFFTGAHEDYHKPTDDTHLVNFEGIHEISDYILALIGKLDDSPKLKFTKTKDQDEKKAAAFKVTLGVMPDYSWNEKGMRIDAVIEGRVGHKAGLKDGDVVVELGGMKVEDIYAYMEALAKFEKGQSTDVVVKRGKKKVTKKVTF